MNQCVACGRPANSNDVCESCEYEYFLREQESLAQQQAEAEYYANLEAEQYE